jgi:hypothetical protein
LFKNRCVKQMYEKLCQLEKQSMKKNEFGICVWKSKLQSVCQGRGRKKTISYRIQKRWNLEGGLGDLSSAPSGKECAFCFNLTHQELLVHFLVTEQAERNLFLHFLPAQSFCRTGYVGAPFSTSWSRTRNSILIKTLPSFFRVPLSDGIGL